jgi:hypothetical protein
VSASMAHRATGPAARSRPTDAGPAHSAAEPGRVRADDWLQGEPDLVRAGASSRGSAATRASQVSRRRSRPSPRAHSAEAPWGGHYEARAESYDINLTPPPPPAVSTVAGGSGVARQLEFVPPTHSSGRSSMHHGWDGTDSQYEDEYDAALAGATGIRAHHPPSGPRGRGGVTREAFESPRRVARAAWGSGGVMDTVGTFGFADDDEDGD